MPCKPFMCTGSHDCRDTACPGHPQQPQNRIHQCDGGARVDHGQIVGYECALPVQMLCDEPRPRGWNWQLTGYVAIVIVFTAFAYLWATQP